MGDREDKIEADALDNMYWDQLTHEEQLKKAALSQCIYILVEGNSEESNILYLLDKEYAGNIDLEKEGIVIANYSGIKNLYNTIRLLKNILSHNRPIIATFDYDLAGEEFIRKKWPILQRVCDTSNVHLFKIPFKGVVQYTNCKGTTFLGGSYEEMFEPDYFIECCFSENILPEKYSILKSEFLSIFDQAIPWYKQVDDFLKSKGYMKFSKSKVELAGNLAESIDPLPTTINELEKLIKSIRAVNPVKHPDEFIDYSKFGNKSVTEDSDDEW